VKTAARAELAASPEVSTLTIAIITAALITADVAITYSYIPRAWKEAY
jgi:hypothetical protein